MSLIRRRIAERLVRPSNRRPCSRRSTKSTCRPSKNCGPNIATPSKRSTASSSASCRSSSKPSIDALKGQPALNAEIRDDKIVYRHYYHIGIAVSSTKGLVVPVLRSAERLSFAEIEQAIDDFGNRASSNKLEPNDLEGGTFTITNGGIFGSLLSTPIVNPPQSGVLGMHAIQDRPVARDGQVVIRPMMYVALTYDHRLVDGREAVTFLVRIKEAIEDPSRMLLEV